MAQQAKKYIFITGGVLSSLGKGTTAASIAMLLEARGLSLSMVKMDPYLNVDPGTMSPYQHGEVYVLDDGSETDLDLGQYSRFVQNVYFSKKNSFTSGCVYDAVIRRERTGGYLGKTVQVIPHITDEIKAKIEAATQGVDVALIEVGGTVGDIESLPFLEAIRQLRLEKGSQHVLFVHLTLVPYIPSAGELKTKPTQHSVKELREIGIHPDILVCRSDRTMDSTVQSKISLFCNVPVRCVFSAKDVRSIYELPLLLQDQGLDRCIVESLGLATKEPELLDWRQMVERLLTPQKHIEIAVVGKYTDWRNTYKSLSEALIHAGNVFGVDVDVRYVDAEFFQEKELSSVSGVLVPGGFGDRGIDGKIRAIRFAREQKVPFFGICLGMQLCVVEFARNVLGITNAHSSEFDSSSHIVPVVDKLADQSAGQQIGGTMRLGSYECELVPHTAHGSVTKVFLAYQAERISERHRHRYHVVPSYKKALEKAGMLVSGMHQTGSSEGACVELVELVDHPWFVGCQFHPEFKSHPLRPHPLFQHFVQACLSYEQVLLKKKS